MRPRSFRRINVQPTAFFFKPNGIPLRQLEITDLPLDELEALRLKHLEKISQEACAKEMHISQSTFQRILTSAHERITHALIQGEAIRIPEPNNSDLGIS